MISKAFYRGGFAKYNIALEILRSAKVVIDHHGEDALIHAARRADELLERGDVQGYEVWLAIPAVLDSARVHLSGTR